MTHTISRRGTAIGPAVGTSGAALSGPTFSLGVAPSQYIGTISVRLRTRNLSTPVRPGSVFVEVVLVPSGLVTSTGASEADALETVIADWQKAAHVWTGHGAVWHPNVWVNPGDDSYQVVVRVWNRDDLDATASIKVDVSVTISARPVAGEDTANPTFAIGTGTRRRIVTADPAPGAEIIQAVPVGTVWFCHGGRATLVDTAAAANRIPILVCFDGTANRIGNIAGILSQQTSDTWVYLWAYNGATAGAGSIATIGGVTGFYAFPGDSIRTNTLNMNGADNWGAMTLDVEEWAAPSVAAS